MQVDLHDAESQLSQLVDAAAQGKEVILLRDGAPVAKLIPVHSCRGKRVLGQARGQVHLSPDFDVPMQDGDLDEFLGSTLW